MLAAAALAVLPPRDARAGIDGTGASAGDVRSLSLNPAAAIGAPVIEVYAADVGTLAYLRYRRLADSSGSYPMNRAFVFGEGPSVAIRRNLGAAAHDRHALARFGAGISLFVPTGSSVHWPASSPGHYHLIQGTSFAAFLSPVLAWRPVPRLRIGAGPSVVIGSISAEKRIDLAPTLASIFPSSTPPPYESGLLEGNFVVTAWGAGLTGTIGAIWDASDTFRAGISLLGPSDATLRGRSHFTPSLDFAVSADGDFELTKHYPWYLNAGARYRPEPPLTLYFEGQFVGWSRNYRSHVRITSSRVRGTNADLQALLTALGLTESQLVEDVLDRDQGSLNGDHDAANAVVGADWHFVRERVHARGEAGYLLASVPTKYMTPGNVDFDAAILGAGASWRLPGDHVELGLSVTEYFLIGRDVRDSAFRSDSPDPELQLPTGNGDYSGSLTRVIAQATTRF